MIPLSFIIATDFRYTFTLTSHAVLHKNCILVFEVTPCIIFRKSHKNGNTIISFKFQFCYKFMARFPSIFACPFSLDLNIVFGIESTFFLITKNCNTSHTFMHLLEKPCPRSTLILAFATDQWHV